MQVSDNGIIEFSRSGPIRSSGALTDVLDRFPIKNHTFIAPFYADFDSRGGGIIMYNGSVNNSSLALEKAREQISISTEYEQFDPTYLIVATWEEVGYLREESQQVMKHIIIV